MTKRGLPIPRLSDSAPEERAVRWLIANEQATYAQAARRYNVSYNAIRSRIEYRYGSIWMARECADEDPTIVEEQRRCIVCRQTQLMTQSQYICRRCRRSFSQMEDTQ